MIRINQHLAIPDGELSEEFVLASGPGGQNVNKVCTAVKLRFDVAASPSLPGAVKARLLALAGRRADRNGVITIDARQHRVQERNRAAARERLLTLILDALHPPRPRHPTRPTRASKERRIESKRHKATTKARRQPVAPE
jgi:ribosome-associated protein